jgi:hypothetical protein
MPSIDEFSRRVREMEKGTTPADVVALLDRICGTPWETAEERERAQELVARLEKMTPGAVVPEAVASAYDGQALLAEGRRPGGGRRRVAK